MHRIPEDQDNWESTLPLRWRHNGHDSVSNHQPHRCLLNRLFGCRSKKTSKLRVTGLCAGNSPGTGEFPAQMASNAENVSIWWRHHAKTALNKPFFKIKLSSLIKDFTHINKPNMLSHSSHPLFCRNEFHISIQFLPVVAYNLRCGQ